MPTKARHKCAGCGSGVMSTTQPCTHCGSPTPLDPGPISPAVIRCANCGNPTHVAADSCRRCRTPHPDFLPHADATPLPDRQAATRAPAAPTTASGAPYAAPLWDPERTPLDFSRPQTVPQHLAPRQIEQELLTAKEEPEPHLDPRDRVPCGRCAELLARGTYPCPRCGAPDPLTAEPIEHKKKFWGRLHIPTVPLVVAILGSLALGVFTLWTDSVKETERRARIWSALGARASDKQVLEIERESAIIGVSSDVLLRIRFYCLHRETERPTTTALRMTRQQAELAGRDAEQAVTDSARLACKR